MASFGVASLIISVIAIFIPVFGIMLSGLAGVMAWVSAGRGTTLGAAAVIINFLNLFFLSPGYMLAAGLEASARNYEENKLVIIWMIVLFIQIAAIVVFLLNIFTDKLPLISKKQSRAPKTKKSSVDRQTAKEIADPIHSITIDSIEPASKVTKVLIHKVHGGRKKDSKFWNDDIDLNKKKGNNFDIAIDTKQKKRVKDFQQPWMLPPALIIITLVILIIARPDLFPFLDYHNIYDATQKIIPSEQKEIPPIKSSQPEIQKKIYQNKSNQTHKSPASIPKITTQRKRTKTPAQVYQTVNVNIKFDSISLEGKVFSWKDLDGKRFYSNGNLPLTNKTLQVQIGPKNLKSISQIKIIDGDVYLPVTISHNGRTATLPMKIDNERSRTTIPNEYLMKITAKDSDDFVRATIDNKQTYVRVTQIDSLQIGLNVTKKISIGSTDIPGRNNSGYLGKNYIQNHPFKIDYDRQLLVWM